MLTDPIADMLTRIRNANMALHDTVEMPGSRLKSDIARVLEEQGYIVGYDTSTDGTRSTLTIKLKYDDDRRRVITGIDRVSKPGRRVYADKDSLPKVLGGMGVAIISTSQGLLTGHEARRRGVGGEVLCTVW
ncbi:MAG: 30S ribosomal protein S8 [Actinomycetota bacterium]|nr:30S ribosomal protein S8 [Thermoleophilia bacterium]MDA3005319.1 30S ribosomal protein S8 [Actinomycetota bacterium]